VFHTDFVKVDRDIAYVAMVIHACCKRLSLMFHLFFSNICCKCDYLDVIYVSHIYCKCFIWMLYMFAMVFNCFCKCFRCMFQVFHCLFFYVASVVFGCFRSRSGVAHGIPVGSERGSERSSDGRRSGGADGAGTVKRRPGSADPRMEKPTAATGHPDVQTLAMPLIYCC
jgi:hypothetical protein